MATTLGPDMTVEASSDGFVPSSSTRRLPVPIIIDNAVPPLQLSESSQQSPRAQPPLPNPPFVFPARPSPSSAPSSYSRATGRRSRSTVETQDDASPDKPDGDSRPFRSPALPEFSFNPGAALTPSTDHPFLSPPQSPQSPRAIPARPSGGHHKRGGSEFVGGNIRAGEAITVMSTSPTKSESGFASPNLEPTLPVGRPRRGHAHRRSAAISSNDLSVILQPLSPNAQARGSSAPTSPADFERRDHYAFPDTTITSHSPKLDTPPPVSPVEDAPQKVVAPGGPAAAQPSNPVARPIARARVGFSDTLEFIPRPVSLVSSDTSSTITARPGHSLSGSISSIISLTSSTIADRETTSPLVRSPSRASADSRPSTAGPVLERTDSIKINEPKLPSPRRRNSIPLLAALPAPDLSAPSTPSPSKTPKRWSFFGLEPFLGSSSSPTRSRPVSACSSETPPKDNLSATSSTEHVAADSSAAKPEEPAAPSKRVERKSSKKKKKVKTWAGSILTRNSKPRRKNRKNSTPASPAHVEPEESGPEEAADQQGSETEVPTVKITETDDIPAYVETYQPRPASAQEDESTFAMIDLDAALGPFNTPLPRNPEWEAAQRAGGLAKRQLHSAAGMSRFTGPGMHYSHRRAESAPEMPPFNRAGMPRYSSNSTMADVFEEDEEDDDEDDDTSEGTTPGETGSEDPMATENDQAPANIDIRVIDAGEFPIDRYPDTMDDATSSIGLSRRGSGLSGISDDDKTQPSMGLKSEYSASSLHEDIIVEESSDFAFPGPDSACNIIDTSDSTTPSPRRILKGKDLAPVDVSPLHLPTPSLAPISPYSMTPSSSFPSPRSPMSYDANRVSTAPSSITEDNFQSLLMGEPGPEVRISSDMPSLTSSNSTMTRESALAQGPQHRNTVPFQSERPASFTSAAFGRRRSSLASLQRLISTSHGERSKLSMEVTLDGDGEKKPKVSRAKRLSRMMQFWKSKEDASH